MARSRSKVKSAAAPETEEGRVRDRVKRHLVQRFYTRFHMSLILITAGLAAMLTNWVLLHAGVQAMWVRYPVAISLAYVAFLAGVWLWLQYFDNTHGNERKNSFADGADLLNADLVPNVGGGSVQLPDIVRGGGGQFDGGGAGGAWTEANPVQAFAGDGSVPAPSGSNFVSDAGGGIGEKLGSFVDLDGEGLVLIVLALLLIFSVLILSGYIVWFAPDILGEAVFGATLAGTLAKAAKRNDESGWVMGVVKKTWWPFAIVFAAAQAFAIYAAIHFPQASTFSGALAAAVAS